VLLPTGDRPPVELSGVFTPFVFAVLLVLEFHVLIRRLDRHGDQVDRVIRHAWATRMLPIYDCDDHRHPSDLGYRAMGDAIDLALFD